MAGSPAQPDQRPLHQLQVVVDLLETPALARVYAYIVREGPVTVASIIDRLDVPQGTAYDYVQRLDDAGLIRETAGRRPYRYAADPLTLTLTTDEATRTITPALIAAMARRDEDGDIDVYLGRHGIDGLADALEYAYEYVDGTVNHRIAARELDLSPLEAEVILQALEPIAEAYPDPTG